VPINDFRGYAKRRLKAYHGGFKRSFRLYIRELGFRFNNRDDNNGDDENALTYLRSSLYACS
jgi:transposase-like protein